VPSDRNFITVEKGSGEFPVMICSDPLFPLETGYASCVIFVPGGKELIRNLSLIRNDLGPFYMPAPKGKRVDIKGI
jgi:hypothetical protein